MRYGIIPGKLSEGPAHEQILIYYDVIMSFLNDIRNVSLFQNHLIHVNRLVYMENSTCL